MVVGRRLRMVLVAPSLRMALAVPSLHTVHLRLSRPKVDRPTAHHLALRIHMRLRPRTRTAARHLDHLPGNMSLRTMLATRRRTRHLLRSPAKLLRSLVLARRSLALILAHRSPAQNRRMRLRSLGPGHRSLGSLMLGMEEAREGMGNRPRLLLDREVSSRTTISLEDLLGSHKLGEVDGEDN